MSTGARVNWSDIETLYSNLNKVRTKYSFTELSVPNEQNILATPSTISTLKTVIEGMSANTDLGDTTNTDIITVPQQGELLDEDPLIGLAAVIDNMTNACAGNFSFNGSNFSFSGNRNFNATNFGFTCDFTPGATFSSNFSFSGNDSYNNSNNSYNSSNFSFSGNRSYNNSNFSYNSSNFSFSSNRSVRSTNFSFSGNDSFRASNFSFSGNRTYNSSNNSYNSSNNSYNSGNFSFSGNRSFQASRSTSNRTFFGAR